MTDMQRDALFPSPEGSEADRQKEATTGLLPSQMLREAVALGREIVSPQPIGDDQIQPSASICAWARWLTVCAPAFCRAVGPACATSSTSSRCTASI
jgi:hypothetical protein